MGDRPWNLPGSRWYINREKAIEMYMEDVLPQVRRKHEKDGVPDYPARREAWNDFVDALVKEGAARPSVEWAQPRCNVPRRERNERKEKRKLADLERAEKRRERLQIG